MARVVGRHLVVPCKKDQIKNYMPQDYHYAKSNNTATFLLAILLVLSCLFILVDNFRKEDCQIKAHHQYNGMWKGCSLNDDAKNTK